MLETPNAPENFPPIGKENPPMKKNRYKNPKQFLKIKIQNRQRNKQARKARAKNR